MKHPPGATIRYSSLALLLALLLPGAKANQPIEAEIKDAQVAADSDQSPGPVGFTLKYDLRVVNVSETAIYIPDARTNPTSRRWITLLGIESEQADGSWKFIVSPGMLAYKPDTQFAACKILPRGQSEDFKDVPGRFVLFDSQFAHLEPKHTVRAGLVLVCRQQDGSLSSISVTSNPFALLVPPRR